VSDQTDGGAPPLSRPGQEVVWIRAALRGLWFTIVPAVLATLATAFLVPRPLPGAGWLAPVMAAAGQKYATILGVSLFLLFSGLARYWRFYLPGGRHATAPPPGLGGVDHRESLREYEVAAELHERLRAPSMRRRRRRMLAAGDDAEVDQRLDELRRAIARSDDAGTQRAVQALEGVAAPVLAARQRAEWVVTVGAVALAVAAALVLRARLIDSYAVLSPSMLPTLAPGDRFFAHKLSRWAPERGDIIVFPSTAVARDGAGPPEEMVKRVIGLPGDRIGMVGGIPTINGWQVPTCDAGDYLYLAPGAEGTVLRGRLFVEFLDDRAYLTLQAPNPPEFPLTYEVPPGEVFVLGDNRNHSADSRVWAGGSGGGVPLVAVAARGTRFLSGSRLDGRVDWSRLLRPIDALGGIPFVQGFDPRPLGQGLARCLEHRPGNTHPPPAGEAKSRPGG
jgi:signal peptidase I